MENKLTRALYDHAPFVLRNVFASTYGAVKNRRRFRGDYADWYRLFSEAASWSDDRLRAYQWEKVRTHLEIAARHVPYYRERFRELGIEPGDISSLDDLQKLPLLEKADVREAGERLVNEEVDREGLSRIPTSGSTGTPLDIPRRSDIDQMEWAFSWARFKSRVRRDDPYSSFTGLEIVPPGRATPPFWIDNWASRQRMFSIFHLSDANLRHYCNALERRYSRYYVGYSSAVYVLAEYMLREGIRLSRPPEIFFNASEELQPRYADRIREAFGCEVWDRYGQAECAGSITQYECGHLHCDMDYSYLEFLQVGEEDGALLGEIVATNFQDSTWPLLRYRTGDLVVYDPADRCESGVPGAIVRRIHGRTGHYFTLADGSRVTNISVIAKKCPCVQFMQVVQEKPGEIVVNVVPGPDFGDAEKRELINQFRRKIGEETGIEVALVDEIERGSSGKYRSIVNRSP
jgi:phenylacetate-CoA ligase